MAFFVLCLLVLLAISAGHSSATYCVCKDGLGDGVYQKDIDYACGQGADCAQIQEKGTCYNPNTVKDHCNYAVNSYYQKKGQAPGSCDFTGSATVAPTLTSQSSTCVYPSSASPSGTTPSTGTLTPPATGTITPTTPATGTITPTTPATGTTTPTTPTTGISPPTTGTTTPSTGNTFGSPPSSIFGLGPTSINPSTDTSEASKRPFFWAFTLFSGPLLLLVHNMIDGGYFAIWY